MGEAEPRILVIGAEGFVGRRLMGVLEDRFGAGAAFGAGREPVGEAVALDLAEDRSVRAALGRVAPSHVVNLAGIAAPQAARADARLAWETHVFGVERLGRAMLDLCPEAWLLNVGSGLAYGRSALAGRALSEADPLEPMDPYGLTKAAGDLAVGALAQEGLRAVRLRPFNHSGPGQSADFALPAFAGQIARIEAGRQEPVLEVGNLDAARDFLHVDDVAEAYAAVIAATGGLEPGAALNVASGEAARIGALLERLVALSEAEIEVRTDPARQRPSDLPTIAGDAGALRRATGWAPRRSLDDMLGDVLAACRASVAGGARHTGDRG